MSRVASLVGLVFLPTLSAFQGVSLGRPIALFDENSLSRRIHSTGHDPRSWMDNAISRETFLATLAGGFSTIIAGSSPVSAAIPTVEEYAIGSGSKIKGRGSASEGSTTAKRSSTVMDPSDLPGTIVAASEELVHLKGLIGKQQWGDALVLLKAPSLTILKNNTLGLGSIGKVAQALGVTSTKAEEVLEARGEAAFALRQLEDVVFSNARTLQYFNSEDLKQVTTMSKNSDSTNIEEALDLLQTTLSLVSDLLAVMRKSP